MIALAATTGSGSALWYLTRGTGVTALVLLSAVMVLGVLDLRGVATERFPRFLIDALHRRLALLAVVFVVIHIATAVLDSYVSLSWLDAVVPFGASYRPLGVGLGAVAFDLLLAVGISSALRARIGYRAWRAIHWLAYGSWPVAVLHTVSTGTDAHAGWLLLVLLICVLAVVVAVVVRLAGSPRKRGREAAEVAGDGA